MYKFINTNKVEEYNGGFIVLDNKIYTNPLPEILKKVGYKNLIIKDEPEYNLETQYLTPIYIDGDEITQEWEINEKEER